MHRRVAVKMTVTRATLHIMFVSQGTKKKLAAKAETQDRMSRHVILIRGPRVPNSDVDKYT